MLQLRIEPHGGCKPDAMPLRRRRPSFARRKGGPILGAPDGARPTARMREASEPGSTALALGSHMAPFAKGVLASQATGEGDKILEEPEGSKWKHREEADFQL